MADYQEMEGWDEDDIFDILRAFSHGVYDVETAIRQIGFRMWDAYESGWYEATNGKWGLTNENPFPYPYGEEDNRPR
jgi:hypothetical protein